MVVTVHDGLVVVLVACVEKGGDSFSLARGDAKHTDPGV
jgi:hypothetical protein